METIVLRRSGYANTMWRILTRIAIAVMTLAPVTNIAARADVILPAIFSDHMVLQRDAPIPVWGWASPGEKVGVLFAGKTKNAVADTAGKWSVRLDRLPANPNPQSMVVTGANTVNISDVLVGEVWLCSGQSNMTYRMGYDRSYFATEIAAANDPGLRNFLVDFHTSPSPDEALQKSAYQVWETATPGPVEHSFPVVGYFFGRELRRRFGTGVPVGLIHSSYPASPIEPWISREALDTDTAFKTMADTQIANMVGYPDALIAFHRDVAAWEVANGAADHPVLPETQQWAQPEFDDAAWKTTELPMTLGTIGLPAGGAVWLRKTIDVSASSAGKGLVIKTNYASDDYLVYFNGKPIDDSVKTPRSLNESRAFYVPGSLVHAGANHVAIRVFAHTRDGGLSLRLNEVGVPVEQGNWRYAVEFANPALLENAASAFPHAPNAVPQYTSTYVFNAMIYPIVPYAIRGAIWYQGESNTGRAFQYRGLLPLLISDWRNRWGEGDFPFYIVQLANFMPPKSTPTESAWAELREAQAQTARSVRNSGLAVTIDIGDANDIHPRNKLDVGKRLALLALARTYGDKIADSGPIYQSATVEGQAIRVHFDRSGGNLIARGGPPLKQFAIAGADRKFVWADARIEGDTIIVSSPAIANPVAVRYAWADNPDGCNLTNATGLPASPFRTDDWPGITSTNP